MTPLRAKRGGGGRGRGVCWFRMKRLGFRVSGFRFSGLRVLGVGRGGFGGRQPPKLLVGPNIGGFGGQQPPKYLVF